MKEQWIQQMQQKLAGYRQPAPEVSWDEIEKALANNRQKAKARMVQMWTRRIAAAVVVLVADSGSRCGAGGCHNRLSGIESAGGDYNS